MGTKSNDIVRDILGSYYKTDFRSDDPNRTTTWIGQGSYDGVGKKCYWQLLISYEFGIRFIFVFLY